MLRDDILLKPASTKKPAARPYGFPSGGQGWVAGLMSNVAPDLFVDDLETHIIRSYDKVAWGEHWSTYYKSVSKANWLLVQLIVDDLAPRWVEETTGRERFPRLGALLQLLSTCESNAEVSNAAAELWQLLQEDVARGELIFWIRWNGRTWLDEKRPGLAAILEASARISLIGIDVFSLDVLRTADIHPLVLTTALKWIPFIVKSDSPLVHDFGVEVLRLTSCQEAGIEVNAAAISCTPYVMPRSADEVLVAAIVERSSDIAYSAALTALEWAAQSGSFSSAMELQNDQRERLCVAALQRLRYDGEDESETKDSLREALVWCLGALASVSRLDEVVSVLAKSFRRGWGAEDAAAV